MKPIRLRFVERSNCWTYWCYMRSDFSKGHISIFVLQASFDRIALMILNYTPSGTKHYEIGLGNSFWKYCSEIVSFSLCDVLRQINMCTDSSRSLHALACSTVDFHVPICRREEYYHSPVTHLTSVPTDPCFVTLIGNGAFDTHSGDTTV